MRTLPARKPTSLPSAPVGGVMLSDSTPNVFLRHHHPSDAQPLGNAIWHRRAGRHGLLPVHDNAAPGFNGFIWVLGGVHNDNYVNAGGGTEMMHLVASGLYVNGAIALTSDRNAKENFAPVSPREVLDKVAALPISRWNFKEDKASEHLGPMAQDFYAAFNVGPDDKHIATVDADGVALAAIQGLNQKVEERLKAKDDEMEMVKNSLEELKRLVLKATAQSGRNEFVDASRAGFVLPENLSSSPITGTVFLKRAAACSPPRPTFPLRPQAGPTTARRVRRSRRRGRQNRWTGRTLSPIPTDDNAVSSSCGIHP